MREYFSNYLKKLSDSDLLYEIYKWDSIRHSLEEYSEHFCKYKKCNECRGFKAQAFREELLNRKLGTLEQILAR